MIVNKIKKIISGLFLEPTIISPFTQDLKGKVVLITGASKGIGRAIAISLLQESATVIAIARNKKELELAFAKIKSGNVMLLEADITSEQQVTLAIKKITEKYKKIDAVVNNAGVFLDKPLESVLESEFQKIMDTNVKGIFLVCKTIIPIMKVQKKGLIVNIGSKISHNTNVTPKKVLYATTKYAVEGFSIALGKELHKFGIRVTALMPGTVNTFVSFKSKEYLPPYSIGFVVSMLLKSENIHFESIILKSTSQNI